MTVETINEKQVISETCGNAQTLTTGDSGSPNSSGVQRLPNSKEYVRGLYQLLGHQTVLLPVEAREKGARLKRWNELTFEKTQNEYYQSLLQTHRNHGVLLGKASGGLCAIDVDDDDGVEPFLKINPRLQLTLRTRGARGCQIWVKIKGEFPILTKIKTTEGDAWGEWRADGGMSIVSGIHPDGMEYKRLVDAQPIEIAFDDICWPDNLKLPWVKTPGELLIEQEGPPFQLDKDGWLVGSLNELYFVEKYRLEHAVLFEPLENRFYEYYPENGLWKFKTDLAVSGTFERNLTEMAQTFDSDSVKNALLFRRGAKLFTPWVKSLKARSLKTDIFEHRPLAIHVKNGMLLMDRKPPELVSFHPEFYSRNQIPFTYDPDAKCSRFLGQLLGSALDDDDISLLQRWCGAVLLGGNAAQRIMLITGTPGGGKSSVVGMLESVIGPDNVASLRTEQLSEKFEMAAFTGKTLLAAKDVSDKFMMQRGVHKLKSLVGNDRMHAEFKGANERVPIRGNFNVVITCNSQLNIKLEGDDDAWLRRLLLINYDRPISTQRISEFDKILLREEGDGILKWMVDGAIAHQQELAECGNFKLTKAQQMRVVDLLDQSNEASKRFLEQKVVPFPGATISSAELVAAFQACGVAGGYSPGKLAQELPSLMGQSFGASVAHDIKRDGKNVRGYHNLWIQPEEIKNAA